tara:strand:+ start:102 stop:782 length:681 start_codon:yes stop_codon:yes gene_type:complete
MVPYKKSIIFFPAKLKQNVPYELYNNFITKLESEYKVYISDNDIEMNINKIKEIQSNDEDVLLLSHSNGANNLMDTLNNTDNVKSILIDPIDTNKYNLKYEYNFNIDFEKINDNIIKFIETNHIDKLKNIIFKKEYDEISVKNEILVLNNKNSDKWRFAPIVPPINTLRMDFENQKIKRVFMNDFNHFDLLDKPWANFINKVTFNDNKDYDEYYNTLINEIKTFYN